MSEMMMSDDRRKRNRRNIGERWRTGHLLFLAKWVAIITLLRGLVAS